MLTLLPFRLTGLLSFMMSDEITTGSVNTTDADKRVWARKSHPWNLQQRKFKEAFPEVSYFYFGVQLMLKGPQYCTPAMRDLPNMGESAQGKSSDPTSSRPPTQQTSQRVVEQPRVVPTSQSAASQPSATDPKAAAEANSSDSSGGWADIIWQKWRWGLFIAIAVVVSRLSSS